MKILLILILILILRGTDDLIRPVVGRVAGKIGFINNNYNGNGRSHSGINEEIIWVSIGMGIAIAVLISIALCYIMKEKCQKRREYYISA